MSTKCKKNADLTIGLEIGTDAVGYAVVDKEYKVKKYHGEPMWGVTMFEPASSKRERRDFRTERRRLDRSQQRILMTQEIFAREIAKVDSNFFIRLKEGGLHRNITTTNSTYHLFEKGYTDKEYHEQYPTIHHLIVDLMEEESPKDVRLVYLAIAWLMKHRGHFLNESDRRNMEKVITFEEIYQSFDEYCRECFGRKLWVCSPNYFAQTMATEISVKAKEQAFYQLLNGGKKFKKEKTDVVNREYVIRLLSGGKVKPGKLFLKSSYREMDSISLAMEEDSFQAVVEEMGSDGEFLVILREMYDWALLKKTLGGLSDISAAKVKMYEQHRQDLIYLKQFVRKYAPEKYYLIFKEEGLGNYAAYSGHGKTPRCDKEVFCSFLEKMLDNTTVDDADAAAYSDMMERVSNRSFMPRQTGRDSRIIPYQLYWKELYTILNQARKYLPFLSDVDESGLSNAEKLLEIFSFRVPYYVGPLRTDNSHFAWMKRKENGKITPWNFTEKIDMEKTEQEFIDRMTGQCRYLPGEDVLPKSSLLYQKFLILEDLNARVDDHGEKLSVKEKQKLFYEIWNSKNKNSRFLLDLLGESAAEEIIRYFTYVQDKARRKLWIETHYKELEETQKKKVVHLSFHDFGRVSEKFLSGIEGTCKASGEIMTIMDALWNTPDSLAEILSDDYTFSDKLEEEQRSYYEQNTMSIESILEQMYIPNTMHRSIYRTLAVLSDIKTATKTTPKRICLSMMETTWEKSRKRFLYRQLSATRKVPKAMMTILKLLYPETEIVYIRPGAVGDFRKQQDLVRTRSINDFYHGKDAYLNVICGSGKSKVLTKNEQESIRKLLAKNNLHHTRFPYERKGGLFDQMPLKKGNGYVRRKADLPIETYGGYNRPTASFFILVIFKIKRNQDMMFLTVDLHEADRVLNDRSYAVKYAERMIKSILKKGEVEIVNFPFGMRKFKMNTLLSLDGYRMTLNGTASAKRQLVVASQEPLVLSEPLERYVKRIENILKRIEETGISRVDRWEDDIDGARNMELYNALTIKMGNAKFAEQFGPNLDYLEKSRDDFKALRLDEQIQVLANMIRLFKTGRVVGCDLSKVGGRKNSGNRPLSANLSNWRKRFSDVRIIDVSPSGIFEKTSANLLKMF